MAEMEYIRHDIPEESFVAMIRHENDQLYNEINHLTTEFA